MIVTYRLMSKYHEGVKVVDLNEAKTKGYEKLGETVCKKLNSLGYCAWFVKTRKRRRRPLCG